MANPTIGYITCPIKGDRAEVRRYSKGTRKLYYYGLAGKITPNSAEGQQWMLENTEFINGNENPLPPAKQVQQPAKNPVNGNLPGNTQKQEKPRSFLDKFFFDDEPE